MKKAEGDERELNRYGSIIERVFFDHYQDGMAEVTFTSQEFVDAATALGLVLPKNPADILYSFRFRTPLPASIQQTAGRKLEWVIKLAGRGRYRFVLLPPRAVTPQPGLAYIKVPNSTPGLIERYAFDDEQALLARLRYNRLLDTFTGVTCYSLQNHLRTAVRGMGQIEADEVYIGVSRSGAHYCLPVEAKGRKETLGILQIEQGYELCRARFPELICRPIGAQLSKDDTIALFEFELQDGDMRIVTERHYRLVPPTEVTPEDLEVYRMHTD
jgi:hypothetical protein